MTGTSLSAFSPSAHPNAQSSSVSLTDVTVLAPAVPAELTPILGREEALAALAARLADSRLLTLIGTGRCGKTRLALAVAHELLRGSLLLVPAPRIGWLEFAQLESGVHLPTTIAATMGLVVPPERDATEAIILASQATPRLLVLDNCEHLLRDCATLVTRLLLSAPSLRIIATSREPLGVPGEVTWAVTPLPVPGDGSSALTPGAAMGIPSVRLFVERARDALPHFTLHEANVGDVAQLCRRLDGLPLAIELAAARVRALGPSQLLARADALLPLLRRRGQGGPLGTGPSRRRSIGPTDCSRRTSSACCARAASLRAPSPWMPSSAWWPPSRRRRGRRRTVIPSTCWQRWSSGRS